ncbi:MAG: SpoIVB peptidase S55 domain-containing protein, partial [Oscillospiraceae bacterium]
TAGSPGELMGAFITDSRNGTIEINSERGLFGRMDSAPVFGSAMPIAMRQEVQTGEAVILSTLKGCAPSEYTISIEKIDLNDSEDSHNMVIKVTDEELISEAGGIVQGMSGSPIIQNGKIVGAVTHVFVNDPLKGYAIFADSMYDEMQTLNSADKAA